MISVDIMCSFIAPMLSGIWIFSIGWPIEQAQAGHLLKWFNLVALLDFLKVIGPKGTYSDSVMSHFMEVVTLKICIHRFTTISFTIES